MRIATFNVNSVRARLPVVCRWLEETRPDVVAMQEIKCVDEAFPRAEFEALGYELAIHGQKSYNGVAIASLKPIEDVTFGFEGDEWPQDRRVMRAVVDGVAIVNTYVPNGTSVGSEKFAYKLAWLEELNRDVAARYSPGDAVVWLGDINIAPGDADVYEPDRHRRSIGFHPEEHARLERLMGWGWTDCFRKFDTGDGHYTFWEYKIPKCFERNLGWRIDHVYASPGLVARCAACEIERTPRTWERPSDHTPVVAEFETA